jgi:hypothetical protein
MRVVERKKAQATEEKLNEGSGDVKEGILGVVKILVASYFIFAHRKSNNHWNVTNYLCCPLEVFCKGL